ncbi:MAG: ABC transporter ATP-binding protein, partial [Bacteroidales bacterium]|nr:ABC transporter ATP-binding protein [Bacteroidales bacterium]
GRFSYTNWFGKVDPVSHNSIVDALEKTGLHEFSARMISELSDGERQRAMIAMILAQDPEIMVMDEPAVFLDIKNKYEIFHLIRNLSRKKNKTIIFSTHDLHSAINMADKVWLMLDEGLCQGAPEDLMIKGAFNDLFGNTGFSYDPRYEKDQEKEKKLTGIYIDGTGDYKYWTEKAVARAGLHVSAEKTEIIVKTPSEKIMKWVLRDVTGEYEFESIYEMIKWISR